MVALQRKQREAATDEALVFRIIAVKLGVDQDGGAITTSGIEVFESNADARRLVARNSADRELWPKRGDGGLRRAGYRGG